MASLIREPNGCRRVEFSWPQGQRQRIRLGKLSQRSAEGVQTKIEHLIAAAASGCGWDADTADWVGRLGDDLADKIAAVGLIPKRERVASPTIKAFVEELRDSRPNLKPNTRRNYDQTIRRLTKHFGEDRTLDSINAGDADQWCDKMLTDGLAKATVSREVKRARQFFKAAVRRKLISENPFADVATPAQVNKSREFFVTREVTEKVLAACPDAEWRLIVALSRYGGVRCPSETQALQWSDIDWERGRMNVRSPKTEHLAGGEFRTVPIFTELRPYLEEAFEQAEPGAKYVIARYRGENQNLRTQFERILRRAGVRAWERLFHNLRGSRETELTSEHPLHVVCNWIGNSALIAARHYLQVTDDHFAKATGEKNASGLVSQGGDTQNPRGAKSGAKCGATFVKTEAQKAAQHPVAQKRTSAQNTKKPGENRAEMRGSATACATIQNNRVPRRGVEPLSPP